MSFSIIHNLKEIKHRSFSILSYILASSEFDELSNSFIELNHVFNEKYFDFIHNLSLMAITAYRLDEEQLPFIDKIDEKKTCDIGRYFNGEEKVSLRDILTNLAYTSHKEIPLLPLGKKQKHIERVAILNEGKENCIEVRIVVVISLLLSFCSKMLVNFEEANDT